MGHYVLADRKIGKALLAIFLDFLSLLLAAFIAQYFRNTLDAGIPLPVYAFALILWLTVFGYLNIYSPGNRVRLSEELRRVMVGVLLMLLTLAGALYFSFREVSRLLILYFFVSCAALMIAWRMGGGVLRSFIMAPERRERRVMVVGISTEIQNFVAAIEGYGWADYKLVGFVADTVEAELFGYPVLGGLDEVATVIERDAIHDVVVALESSDFAQLNPLVGLLQRFAIRIHVLPDYLSLALHRATVENFGGTPLIQLRAPALSPYQRLSKRIFDLVVGLMLTALLLPLMALVVLAVKLDSRGTVLFRQQRAGENGQIFEMLKFRSMVMDAESPDIEVLPDAPASHKMKDDPRITRVGRFLRHTSLDELPQLFNVLRGEMSLVGPRPEMPWLVDGYKPWQRVRFSVPQGITGWWQINSRDQQPMALHTDDDLYYINNYSIWLDMWIIIRTVPAVLRRRGAY